MYLLQAGRQAGRHQQVIISLCAHVQCDISVCLSSFAYRNTTTSSTTSMMRSKTAMTAMGAMITAGLRGVAITVDRIIHAC